jgi:hypothetical protein
LRSLVGRQPFDSIFIPLGFHTFPIVFLTFRHAHPLAES